MAGALCFAVAQSGGGARWPKPETPTALPAHTSACLLELPVARVRTGPTRHTGHSLCVLTLVSCLKITSEIVLEHSVIRERRTELPERQTTSKHSTDRDDTEHLTGQTHTYPCLLSGTW